MTFDIENWGRGSTTVANTSIEYRYTSAADNAATIATAAYFNTVKEGLRINDTIYVVASDGSGYYKVTAVSPNVTITPEATIGVGGVASNQLVDSLVKYVRVPVTLAEFIGSNTAPHELLAAPGAGLKYVVHRAALGIDYGGTVLAAGGTVQLTYGAAAGDAAAIATGNVAAAAVIAATADTMFGFSPLDTTLLDAKTVNAALSLSTETQDFTGGAGSTYEVDVWYSIVAQV